jgi:hypothetical protein
MAVHQATSRRKSRRGTGPPDPAAGVPEDDRNSGPDGAELRLSGTPTAGSVRPVGRSRLDDLVAGDAVAAERIETVMTILVRKARELAGDR